MCDIWMDVDVALSEVPVNIMSLLDDTDFKTRETAVAFNAAGMDLVWNFVTTAGAYTQTAVTPTSAGNYDWTHQGDGMYSIEIPASGGASINNDTEGFGWFTGVATGVLPWRGPIIGLRAAGLNDVLIDNAYSTTRGLAGTALPAVAAEAAGGVYTRGSGAGQINQQANGQIDTNLERWINVAPLALSSQRVQVLVVAITNGVIVAATFAANALDAVWSTATRVLTAATNLTTALATPTNITAGTIATVSGNVNGSVGSVTSAVAITSNVKKNQALTNFEFLMTDSTTHAPVTGKTVTCTRSIDAGAFAAGTLASVAEIGSGIYKVNFGAGDLNGNVIVLQATAAGCDATFERIVTQP